jgi:hypothetical protein
MSEEKLRHSLSRAKKYLSIVSSFEKTGRFSEEYYEWLSRNSRILEEEMIGLEYGIMEPGMQDGYGKRLYQMRGPISVFPSYLKTGFPIDKELIFPTLKLNLNVYIQKVEEILSNKSALKKVTKKEKFVEKRIAKFDKVKLIELIVVVFYGTSLFLLFDKDLFIYGFVLNIISVIAILFFSFIKWEEN